MKVWATRIVIKTARGESPLELIVRNDCFSYQYVQHTIKQYVCSVPQFKNMLTVWNNWHYKDQGAGHYIVEVAGTCIGSITITGEKAWFSHGLGARVIPQVKKYMATLTLQSLPYSWQNIIDVRHDHNPNVIMREAVKHYQMEHIPDEAARWLKSAAEHIPDNPLCGKILYTGVKIGSFKIEETHG